MWRLIWVCTDCLSPFYGFPSKNGLRIETIFDGLRHPGKQMGNNKKIRKCEFIVICLCNNSRNRFALRCIDTPIILLTLKAPITAAADDFHKHFFIVFQRE